MGELLKVEGLTKYFPIKKGIIFKKEVGRVHAVDGVGFVVNKGETLGLVGESGCGKSTTARLVTRLIEPTSGQVFFEGENILTYEKRKMRRLRREMQIIFQDPFASLNPRMTVGEIITEPLTVHDVGTRKERLKTAYELLRIVGLNPEYITRYPHEFSGGERQRIGIARALALKPRFIVCDEPVSSLDVSIQSQIINLLVDLQREFKLTYLFIAHDLGIVKYICDRIAVMYLGKIVELSDGEEFYRNPYHPYSQSLLSAVPIPDPLKERKRKRIILKGDIPSPVEPPSGCYFRTRCPIAKDNCAQVEPELKEVKRNHWAACHFAKPNPIPLD